MVWYDMVWYDMVWFGMVWFGMVWHGMVWYGVVYLLFCSIESYVGNLWRGMALRVLV